MNLPKTGRANKVVYQRPHEKEMGRRKRYADEGKVKILLGRPPQVGDIAGGSPESAVPVDWTWVKDMARKEIAEFIPYKLSWGCPHGAGRGEPPGDSPKCAFSVSSVRDKKRNPVPPTAKTRLHNATPNRPQARCARSRNARISNRPQAKISAKKTIMLPCLCPCAHCANRL
jgi:hypothetical protein